MSLARVADLCVMVLVAGSLACIGEIVLGKRARDLFDWNRAFVVGSTLAAALLFPLSLVFGSHALTAALVIVGALATWRVATTVRQGQVRESLASLVRPWGRWWTIGIPSQLALTVILGAVACFAFLAVVRAYAFDGFVIWATKAMVLFDKGRLTKELLRTYGVNIDRVVNYPPLLPLLEALCARVRGHFDWLAVKPVCLLFYVSLLVSAYHAGRALLSRPVALTVVVLLASLPCVSGSTSFGGYSDMPLAAIVALVLAESLAAEPGSGGYRSPLPWCLAGLLSAKSEGLILLGVACAVILLYRLTERPRPWRSRTFWEASSVVVVSLLLRLSYLAWTGVGDPDFWPNGQLRLVDVPARVPLLARTCLGMLTAFRVWAVFWPAFAVASIAILLWARRPGRYLVLAAWLGLLAYTGLFLLTNWDMVLHIENAYDRLLSHLAPIAAVCIGYGFQLGSSHQASRAGPVLGCTA